MSKFKVGDRVKSTMYETKNCVGTVLGYNRNSGCNVLVEFDSFTDGHDGFGWNGLRGKMGRCYYCFEEYLEAVHPVDETHPKILITTPQGNPLDSAKERYALADRMCKMGACSPNSKRKNTCPFVGIDKGGFGCLIYAVACPETKKIMEDYLAGEEHTDER
jgi:hypothetical protein